MKLIGAIALVLFQASLHSCRTRSPVSLAHDESSEVLVSQKLAPKLVQIIQGLDSSDAKITKIRKLIPIYDELNKWRFDSRKHLVEIMPLKKKGKPLTFILAGNTAYVNKIQNPIGLHHAADGRRDEKERDENVHDGKRRNELESDESDSDSAADESSSNNSDSDSEESLRLEYTGVSKPLAHKTSHHHKKHSHNHSHSSNRHKSHHSKHTNTGSSYNTLEHANVSHNTKHGNVTAIRRKIADTDNSESNESDSNKVDSELTELYDRHENPVYHSKRENEDEEVSYFGSSEYDAESAELHHLPGNLVHDYKHGNQENADTEESESDSNESDSNESDSNESDSKPPQLLLTNRHIVHDSKKLNHKTENRDDKSDSDSNESDSNSAELHRPHGNLKHHSEHGNHDSEIEHENGDSDLHSNKSDSESYESDPDSIESDSKSSESEKAHDEEENRSLDLQHQHSNVLDNSKQLKDAHSDKSKSVSNESELESNYQDLGYNLDPESISDSSELPSGYDEYDYLHPASNESDINIEIKDSVPDFVAEELNSDSKSSESKLDLELIESNYDLGKPYSDYNSEFKKPRKPDSDNNFESSEPSLYSSSEFDSDINSDSMSSEPDSTLRKYYNLEPVDTDLKSRKSDLESIPDSTVADSESSEFVSESQPSESESTTNSEASESDSKLSASDSESVESDSNSDEYKPSESISEHSNGLEELVVPERHDNSIRYQNGVHKKPSKTLCSPNSQKGKTKGRGKKTYKLSFIFNK